MDKRTLQSTDPEETLPLLCIDGERGVYLLRDSVPPGPKDLPSQITDFLL